MTSNETDFDNYVKEALHNHKSLVPQGLWDKIIADKPTKKPLVFWWNDNKMYLLAAACVLLIGGTYFFCKTKEKTSIASQIKMQPSNTNNYTNNKLQNNIDNNTTLNNNTFTNNNPTANNDEIVNNSYSDLKGKAFNQLNNPQKRFTSTNQINNINSNLNNDASVKSNIFLPLNKLNGDKENDAFFGTHLTRENTVSISNLLKLEAKSPTTLQLAANKKIFGLDCPNAVPSNWYLEVYGSPDYTTKKIFANGINDAYLQRIDSTTKMNGGFTFGLRVSKSINEHLLVKAGLQYAQRNEQFTSKSDSIITTTSVVTVRTIVRGGGLSDTTIRDTSSLQQIGYRKRITNNKYKSIEVPLLLSYERGNDKWRIAVNAGAIVNLASFYSGETLDTSYQLVPLSAKSNNGFYKSNLNLSLYAGISILRRLNNNLEAFAEPYFRYSLSNSNTSAVGYNQRFNAAGLSLGLRYKLNRKGSVL